MRNTEMPISLITLALAMSISTFGQDQKAAIEQKLESEYALTQATADETDIVTAGAVIVLKPKRGVLVMAPVSTTNVYQNAYVDGKITQNAAAKVKKGFSKFGKVPGVSLIPGVGGTAAAAGGVASTATGAEPRTFVPGEKMWVTKIDVKPDNSVVFELFTDAYADVRYKASLAFKFPKETPLSLDLVDKTVAEVFKVQPADDKKADGQQQQPAGGGQQQQAPGNAPPPAPAAPEPAAVIPPPPPPPADAPQAAPTTTSLGQTTDQVISDMGQPVKIVKLGTKQIYYYKDLKVIFVNGKVTDVQ